MNLQLAVLFLVSILHLTMVTAGPISDVNLEEDVEALLQMLGEQDDQAEEQVGGPTYCARRTHKVHFDIGSRSYTYRYRICFNHAYHTKCYDMRESLPNYCPSHFRGEDCVTVEWRIHRSTKHFEICDFYGVPCQQRIPGLSRSNHQGQCAPYHYQSFLKELMKSAKATDDGPEDAETMTNEDCLCVTKNRHKTCEGQCTKG